MPIVTVGRLDPKDIRPNKDGETRWIKGQIKLHVKCIPLLRKIKQKKLPFTYVSGEMLPKDFAILLGEFTEYPIPNTNIIWKTLEIQKIITRHSPLLKSLHIPFEQAIERVASEDPEFLAAIGSLELQIRKQIIELVGAKNRFADHLINQFGLDAYEKLCENPWKMMGVIPYFGLEQADKVAGKLGIPLSSPLRFEAYFNLCMAEQFTSHQNTYLSENEFQALYWMKFSDNYSQEEYRRLAPIKHTNLGYHPKDFYYAERATVDLINHSFGIRIPETKEEKRLEQMVLERGFLPSKEQYHAIHSAFHTPLHLLTGGPGTGKTTVLKIILEKLMLLTGSSPFADDAPFLLVAPTGKAAYRMYEQTGVPAHTIHSAFGIVPGYGCPNEEDAARRLSHVEYLIIDESSMLDTLLFGDLCKILLKMSHIPFLLLVGDADQLNPVGNGQVFKDLLAIFEAKAPDRITKLTEIKRQTGESHIPELAAFIRNGQFPEESWFADKPDIFFVPTTMDTFEGTLINGVLKPKQEELTTIQILTPYRNGQTPDTIFSIAKMVEPLYNPKPASVPAIAAGNPVKLFHKGDKVINRQNLSPTIINGSLGEITELYATNRDVFSRSMDITFENGETRNFIYDEFKYLEPAYAITIHSSQGSEYENVVLCLMRGTVSADFLCRNLLYVGVTRASSKLVLMGSIDTFQRAAAQEGRPRKTALRPWAMEE